MPESWPANRRERMDAAFARYFGFLHRELTAPVRRPLDAGWWRHTRRTLEGQHLLIEFVGTTLWIGLVVSMLNQVPRLPFARHDGFVHGLPEAMRAAAIFTAVMISLRWSDRPTRPGDGG